MKGINTAFLFKSLVIKIKTSVNYSLQNDKLQGGKKRKIIALML